jgi:hypothetical protein
LDWKGSCCDRECECCFVSVPWTFMTLKL